MAGRGYETASRRRILDFLKSNESRAVTAADIDDYLKESGARSIIRRFIAIWISLHMRGLS